MPRNLDTRNKSQYPLINAAKNNFDNLKQTFDKLENDLKRKYDEQNAKIGTMISLISVQLQNQNEGLKTVYSSMKEITPIVTLTLGICQRVLSKETMCSNDKENEMTKATINQLQISADYLNNMNKFMTQKQAEFMNSFDTNIQLIQTVYHLFSCSR
mgnify:CR=1 FL=1